MPVQAPTQDLPFYTVVSTVIPRNRPILVAFYDTLGIRRRHSRLTDFDKCLSSIPRGDPGFKSRMCPSYLHACRKKATKMGRFLGITVKRGIPCRCLDGHVKQPYEMSMAWEPDRRFNFFFNPPAHICAVTYMTEISFNVTLNNHIHSFTICSIIF